MAETSPIPAPLASDPEDVSWALTTAEAMWARGDAAEALKWLRRGAEAASEAEFDDRALALAKVAADLAGRPVQAAPRPAPAAAERLSTSLLGAAPASTPPRSAAPLAAPLAYRGPPSAAPSALPRPSAPPRSVPAPGPASRRPASVPVPSSALESGRFRAAPVPVFHDAPTPPPVTVASDPVVRERSYTQPDEVEQLSEFDEETSERRLEDLLGPAGPPPLAATVPPPAPDEPDEPDEPDDEADAAVHASPPRGSQGPVHGRASDWDAIPTKARRPPEAAPTAVFADLAEGDEEGTQPTSDSRTGRPESPALATSQAVRVVLWKDANGVHVAPHGTVVSAITVDALVVALDPLADIRAWLDPSPRKRGT